VKLPLHRFEKVERNYWQDRPSIVL